MPLYRLTRCFLDNPLPNSSDKSSLFRSRNKQVGPDPAPLWMLPTNERFYTDNLTLLYVILWLKHKKKILHMRHSLGKLSNHWQSSFQVACPDSQYHAQL